MNAIIRDYLQRNWWVYGLAFLLYFVTLLAFGAESFGIYPATVIGGSAMVLSFDLNRRGGTLTRTLLVLPLKIGDVARAWRFVGLVFPVLVFLGILAFGTFGLLTAPESGRAVLERVFIGATTQTLLLGTIFFALTGVRTRSAENRSVAFQVRATIFGMIWGLSLPGAVLITVQLPARFSEMSSVYWVIWVAMALATVAGWFRAETLVRLNLERSADFGGGSRVPRRKVLKEVCRFGGLRYQMVYFGGRFGGFGLLFLGCTAGFLFLQSGFSGRGWKGIDGVFFTAVPFLVITLAITLASQFRLLRTLPISRRTLSVYVILWPLAFSLSFVLVAVVAARALSSEFIAWPDLFAGLVCALVAFGSVPLLLRFGFGIPFFLTIVMLTGLSGGLFGAGDDFHFSQGWTKGAFVGIAFLGGFCLSWWLTYYLIGSRYPWRAGALRLPSRFLSR